MDRKLFKKGPLIEFLVESNPTAILSRNELEEDVGSVFVAKRMIVKYLKNGIINEKLLINQVIQVSNVFGITGVNKLFYITHNDVEFAFIKAILLFLGAYDYKYGVDVEPNHTVMDMLNDTKKKYQLNVPVVIKPLN